MNNLVYNFIELNLIMVALFAVFLLINKSINYITQRILMLLIPIITLSIVVFKNTLLTDNIIFNSLPIINLNVVNVGETATNNSLSFWTVEIVYFAVSVLLLCWLLIKVAKVLYFFRKAEKQNNSSIKILSTTLKESFSFFNFIHLSADLNESEKKVVLEHELSHTQKLHAFDLMVMAIYHVVLWVNPIFFLMKKKLVEIHEYEVDAGMFKKYNNQYIHYLLANTLQGNSAHYLLTSQFYNGLSLTKRTKQMKTEKKNKWALLLVFPLLATGFTLLSLKNHSSPMEHGKEFTLDQDTVVFVDTIYDKVDQYPQFIGGDEAMLQFIAKNTVYPKIDKAAGVEGTVYCEFVVGKDGSIGKVKIVKGVSTTLDAEVVRVISIMPKWIPGEFEKEKVDVRYTIPVKFKIPKKINE